MQRIVHNSSLIPHGALISVCSMNMQFKRTVLPAVFQFPMHIEIMPDWFIDRYGDIWGGFVLKLLLDIRQDNLTVGEPMIYHTKEGNIQRNIIQEHCAHLINDEMINILIHATKNINANDYLTMFSNLVENLERNSKRLSPILSKYINYLIPSMHAWISALEKPL